MRISLSAFIITLCAAGSGVSAHGFLSQVTINGNVYNGNNPSGSNDPSVIRKVSSPNPNYGASNPALTCGPDELPASQVADANPGDTMTFSWRGADQSPWPHNTGPMLTYMASCGSTTCDQFDATQAKWFKIRQVGRKDGSAEWVQQDLYNGGVDTVSIPSKLAPGNYLIRHEIIALHLATQRGMAEFYPGCTQLRVGGSQTGKPQDSELVSLPGAYSDDDPGIYDPEVYDTSATYMFPGPTVAAFVDGSNSTTSSTTTKPNTRPSATKGANPTQTGSSPSVPASGKVCKLKRPSTSLTVKARQLTRRSGSLHQWLSPWSLVYL